MNQANEQGKVFYQVKQEKAIQLHHQEVRTHFLNKMRLLILIMSLGFNYKVIHFMKIQMYFKI